MALLIVHPSDDRITAQMRWDSGQLGALQHLPPAGDPLTLFDVISGLCSTLHPTRVALLVPGAVDSATGLASWSAMPDLGSWDAAAALRRASSVSAHILPVVLAAAAGTGERAAAWSVDGDHLDVGFSVAGRAASTGDNAPPSGCARVRLTGDPAEQAALLAWAFMPDVLAAVDPDPAVSWPLLLTGAASLLPASLDIVPGAD